MEQDKFVINIGRQLGSGGKAVWAYTSMTSS